MERNTIVYIQIFKTHYLLSFLTCLFAISTDQLALLSLKSKITSDPNNVMENWNITSPVCNWIGVTCGNRHRRVTHLNISYMNLTGEIPPELGNLSFLVSLDMTSNYFSGLLPEDLTRLRRLKYIRITDNMFSGEIPRALGELVELETLDLAINQLSGSVPIDIYNITSLRKVALAMNNLSGNFLPSQSGYYLPKLEKLYLKDNHFHGVFPSIILNSSKLIILELSRNKLSGPIPTSLGDLRSLQKLRLDGNNFTSDSVTSELSFIDSLTNCVNLSTLWVNDNPLNGVIPKSIGNFSSSLAVINASNCHIKGNIPDEIGNLSGLITLYLSGNDLIGEIPRTLKNLVKLQRLSFGDNQIEGFIPNQLCDLMSLGIVDFRSNQLTGAIPECFGNLSSLSDLYLSSNKLTSRIPSNIWNLKDLLYLSIRSNSFTGSLSLQIGNLTQVISLDLSMNKFFGDIPDAFGGLTQLQELYAINNNFLGSIPESMGRMLSLVSLDLSRNRLSGKIPKSFEALKYLENFNVSYNELSGEIPENGPFKIFTSGSFMFNTALCGAKRFGVFSCHKSHYKSKMRKVLLLVFIGNGALIFIMCLTYATIRYHGKRAYHVFPDITMIEHPTRFSYYDLLQATENYSKDHLLGKGSFGSVYRSVLRDGTVLAVKVFHIQLERSLKSFEVECEVLRNLRHRNLVKVLGSCTNQDFKAIVLEYMQNGSLEKCLYSKNRYMDITQRFNIMIDVASALEYLHHGHSTSLVHCDLKPENVLLDENMVAHVSDFGITKYLNDEESNTHTTTLATLGYMAPEYGSDGIVSTRCDVYSYGIMLLEMFTRKRPSDRIFYGDKTLKDWIKSSLPSALMQVIDTTLISPEENNVSEKLQCVLSVLELGLRCSSNSLGERKNMKDVYAEITKIKARLVAAYGENSHIVSY